MDVEVLLLIGAAVVGIVVGLLHLVGYVPPRYRTMLRDVQHETADAIAGALRAEFSTMYAKTDADGPDALEALQTNFTELPNKIGVELEAALNRVAASQKAEYAVEAAAAAKSVEMSMVRGVRSLGDVQAKVDNAMAEAILGPALPILRQFAPGLAETLEENPQLIGVIIENPLFKKYIEPRIAQFLGSKSEPSGKNPFLGDLGQ